LHRTALLAERLSPPHLTASGEPPILLTTFTKSLAEALESQLAILVEGEDVRNRVEILNVDRLAHRIVREARGLPTIVDLADERRRWATAAADVGLALSPAFLQHDWEHVILAQDLYTEQAYLTCLRSGRGRPLTKAQRSQVWQVMQRFVAEFQAAAESTHLQIANEATHLLRESRRTRYRHVIVDEGQDLHPAQWRLLRAAVAPGPDDLSSSPPIPTSASTTTAYRWPAWASASEAAADA
jgi:superfamily I DNA/RNA helicase